MGQADNRGAKQRRALTAALMLTCGMVASGQTGSSAAASPTERGNAYYHYALAKNYESLAQQSGRQDYATQAIEEYKLAIGLDPQSRKLQNGLAELYFHLGRIKEAIATAKEQLGKQPDDADAHDLLGKIYLRSLGDGQGVESSQMLQLAIGEYQAIAKLKPNDLQTHLLLGQLYGLNHQPTQAEAEFQAAKRIDGDSEEVAMSMARLYTEQGKLDKAAETLEGVPADSRSARMDLALAGIQDGLHQPGKAAKAYQLALLQEPDNADAQRGLAAALLADGQLDAAQKAYAKLSGADPKDAQSLIRLAEIQRQQGHYDQALSTLKKAETMVSDNVELEYNEGLTYDALGNFDLAIKSMNKALSGLSTSSSEEDRSASNGNRALFLDRIALIDREAGKTADALQAYGRMAQLGADFQSRAALGVVDTYRDAHEWKRALEAAEAAAKTLPKDKDVQLALARQLQDSGQLEKAVDLSKAQLKGTPDDKDVYFTLADMYTRAGDYKQAYGALDQIEPLSKKKDDQVFLDYYRGTVADRQKMYDQAESFFREGLHLDPNSAAIQNDLGYMLAERGVELPEAVSMLQKAVTYDPQNGAYLDSLAWAYYKQSQYALAEEYAQRAALRSPNDPSVLDHLGQIYERNGKLQAAVDAWQKSLSCYKSSLKPEADPADVAKVARRLDTARVKLAKETSPSKTR